MCINSEEIAARKAEIREYYRSRVLNTQSG